MSRVEVLNEEELSAVVGGTGGKRARQRKISNCVNYIRMGASSVGGAGAVVGGLGGALLGESLGVIAGSAVCVGYVASHR